MKFKFKCFVFLDHCHHKSFLHKSYPVHKRFLILSILFIVKKNIFDKTKNVSKSHDDILTTPSISFSRTPLAVIQGLLTLTNGFFFASIHLCIHHLYNIPLSRTQSICVKPVCSADISSPSRGC